MSTVEDLLNCASLSINISGVKVHGKFPATSRITEHNYHNIVEAIEKLRNDLKVNYNLELVSLNVKEEEE